MQLIRSISQLILKILPDDFLVKNRHYRRWVLRWKTVNHSSPIVSSFNKAWTSRSFSRFSSLIFCQTLYTSFALNKGFSLLLSRRNMVRVCLGGAPTWAWCEICCCTSWVIAVFQWVRCAPGSVGSWLCSASQTRKTHTLLSVSTTASNGQSHLHEIISLANLPSSTCALLPSHIKTAFRNRSFLLFFGPLLNNWIALCCCKNIGSWY